MDLEIDEFRRGPKLKGPRTQKDFEGFEKLCQMQCTLLELCGFFNCCKDTLITRVEQKYETKFSTVYKRFKASGRASLRRAQWLNAIDGNNTTMQIHLGKNYLNQSDKIAQVEDVPEKEESIEEVEAGLAAELRTILNSTA